MRKAWTILIVTFVVLLAAGGIYLVYKEKRGGGVATARPEKQDLQKVQSVDKPKDSYDVIVVGTDPEGIAAAVSSARNGLKTLLVEPRTSRTMVGGLMTEGWLNTIDMNYDTVNKSLVPGVHPVLNKGIFAEWYKMVEGQSFDVNSAANAFYKLIKDEKNIDLLMKVNGVAPTVKDLTPDKKTGDNATATKLVTGITVTKSDGSKQGITAKAIIDATQDADIAAAAGVPFTVGREDLGDKTSTMAVTLCFELKNVTPDAWAKIRKALNDDGDSSTDSSEVSANGFGSNMKGYQPVNKDKLKMRGLNIGRQNDDTILINALLIFGVNPFDPKSIEQGIESGKKELPHVVEFMNKNIPGLEKAELAGTAPELYVRETRHMKGMYRLGVLDLLENRDQWDRVALGSYASDIQPTSPADFGNVALEPIQYAVPFRSLVPQQVDGILVVGRSASYDTLAHGSARVIPTGMDEGQSAGSAAKVAIDANVSFRQMAGNKELVAKMQELANKQGMDLKPFKIPDQDYMKHKQYAGLKSAVYVGIASGSYGNKGFKLDEASNPQRVVNNMNTIKKVFASSGMFKGDPSAGIKDIASGADKQPLTLERVTDIMAKGIGMSTEAGKAQAELLAKGVITQASLDTIANKQSLTNGDVYMLFKDMLERLVNVRF